LSVSLRTNLLAIATGRASALRVALQQGEQRVLDQLVQQTLTEPEVQAVLKEMVRSAVLRMIEDQEAPVPSASEEDWLVTIEASLEEIKTALRSGDWSAAPHLSAAAAQGLGMDPETSSAPTAAR